MLQSRDRVGFRNSNFPKVRLRSIATSQTQSFVSFPIPDQTYLVLMFCDVMLAPRSRAFRPSESELRKVEFVLDPFVV